MLWQTHFGKINPQRNPKANAFRRRCTITADVHMSKNSGNNTWLRRPSTHWGKTKHWKWKALKKQDTANCHERWHVFHCDSLSTLRQIVKKESSVWLTDSSTCISLFSWSQVTVGHSASRCWPTAASSQPKWDHKQDERDFSIKRQQTWLLNTCH